MTTAEERLKMIIGDLIFQNCFLQAQVDAAAKDKEEPKKSHLRPVEKNE